MNKLLFFLLILFVYCYYISQQHNYFEYGGIKYEIVAKSVFVFNHEQYLKHNFLVMNIDNHNITVAIIFKKNNYTCFGLVGQRKISTYTISNKPHYIDLHKNSTCFPNGGLEPEYLVVIPKNKNINSYTASLYYEPTNDTISIYNFLDNF